VGSDHRVPRSSGCPPDSGDIGGITLQILPGIETIILTMDPSRYLAGIIFSLAGLMAIIYSSYRDLKKVRMIGILASIAAATGIVYAGDFITVFIFWELLALASLCIIWASDDIRSMGAGYRYLLFHIFGGACASSAALSIPSSPQGRLPSGR